MSLELRKQIKRRKPKYVQQDAHKLKRLAWKWKKPRGKDSKMGKGIKGYKRMVEPGYGSPRNVYGMHMSGLMPIVVHTVQEIDALQKGQGAIIGGTVGARKKIMLIEHAMKKNITLLNVKDGQKFITSVHDAMKKKKEDTKKKTAKEEKKKVEKKEIADKVMTAEEKQEAEKKEKDKVLTKKT